MRGRVRIRGGLLAAVALGAALATAACGEPTAIRGAVDPSSRSRLSLFALGDVGVIPASWIRRWQTQMRVARVLESEQHRRPADAMLLLGDNFYPDGLLEKEL